MGGLNPTVSKGSREGDLGEGKGGGCKHLVRIWELDNALSTYT